ncbi:alpha/beta fold hydrolase [Nonomuraea sp. MG754425]|uniref:alpha/beta fold hydrolase n=1 Tax=Nonomuraea sp. MG754425 TaxID=2570319 RepID=UPI0034D554EE
MGNPASDSPRRGRAAAGFRAGAGADPGAGAGERRVAREAGVLEKSIADPPPGAPVPPILPPVNGFLFLDRDKFHGSFAADLPAQQAAFLADAQVPWGVDALGGAVTEPAWRHKPAWYLVATEDRMIPPPAQRAMAERAGASTVEVIGSHAVYVSQAASVADLVRQAAA